MTILDSLRSSNELKSNPELSKLLSLKPTMKQKRTQEKKINQEYQLVRGSTQVIQDENSDWRELSNRSQVEEAKRTRNCGLV